MDYSSPLVSSRNHISEQCSDSVKCDQNGGSVLSSDLSCQPSTDDPETFKCASKNDDRDSAQYERRARLRLPLNGIIVRADETSPLFPCNGEPIISTGIVNKSIDNETNDLHYIKESANIGEEVSNENSTNEKRPKGIVKTPSDRRISSSSRRILFNNDCSRSPNRKSISESIDTERPTLHVQFNSGCTDGSVTTAPVGEGSSPASSLSGSTSSSSSEGDSSLRLTEARPPDGGWGWVVVLATFLVNLIADGVTFSFGVLFVNFLEYFGEGKAKTAWIGSLFMAMPLLSGPIASFLTDRYGCRKMCICGSILACLGFVVSAFISNMETLFFTFGIVSGFGLSLCYVAAVVIVAYYFEKKRSLATGLSVCGSGIGTFIFAPLTQLLLDKYGWRGTTLILAGFFLNISVCGALMRDLEWTTVMAKAKAEDRKRCREQKRIKRYESSADSFSDNKSTNAVGLTQQPPEASNGEAKTEDNIEQISRQFSSLVNLPTYVNNGEKVPVEVLELLASKKNVYNVLLQNYPSMLISSRSFSDSGKIHETGSKHANTPLGSLHPISELKDDGLNHSTPPPSRPPPAYLKDLRIHRHSLTYRGAMLNINRYRLRASSCPNIYRNSMTTIAKEKLVWYAGLWEFWDLIMDMLDLSHFKNPHFLIFAISNFLLYTWYDVPYVYISDNAVEMGFSETDGSILISAIGIVNMFGEILLGWVGDWESVDAGLIYAFCMVLCGVVTALVPLLSSYAGLCAASGAFGFFIAANYSLTSIILVELITLENFTSAYGLLLLVQGVANLVGPPLAGWLYDLTGTYELSFYLAGLFILLSGLLLFVLPINKKFKKYRAMRRKETASASTSSVEDTSGIAAINGGSKIEKSSQIFV